MTDVAVANTRGKRPGFFARRMQDLSIIETILRDRAHFFGEIRDGAGLGDKARALLICGIGCLALYGGVLGMTSSPLQTVSSAVKLPLLFLATLVICTPTLYFFNILFGSNQSLTQNFVLILTAITVTGVLLLSFAPIVIFFILTTSSYQFFKLLNVAIFAVCGIIGVIFLSQGMAIVSTGGKEGTPARRWVVRLWVLVYAFVGSQMAWTLRPYIGAPGMPFELFRQLGGNFYTDILASIGEILGLFVVK